MNVIPKSEDRELIRLINETYTDRVDSIESASLQDNGSIECIARDGRKRLQVIIDDASIAIRLISNGMNFSAPEDDDPIADLIPELADIGNATFSQWFTSLQDLMRSSDNLTDFQDKLLDAYPDLDAAEFKQAMIDASTVAGMQGYLDASDLPSSEGAGGG